MTGCDTPFSLPIRSGGLADDQRSPERDAGDYGAEAAVFVRGYRELPGLGGRFSFRYS